MALPFLSVAAAPPHYFASVLSLSLSGGFGVTAHGVCRQVVVGVGRDLEVFFFVDGCRAASGVFVCFLVGTA